MKKLLITLSLFLSLSAYSQCDSIQLQNEIDIADKNTTINFLSEKLYESDVKIDNLKRQLQDTKVEVMKQRTIKWIAIIGGTYISGMTLLMYIKK